MSAVHVTVSYTRNSVLYLTDDLDAAIVAALITTHCTSHAPGPVTIAKVEKVKRLVISKYYARGKIPSLNSLWRRWCNSELLGVFFLSTNAKLKKMTEDSVIRYAWTRWNVYISIEIVEMYIFQMYLHYFFLHVLYCSKTVIYSIFDFAPEIHFFEKIFPAYLEWLKSWKSNERGGLNWVLNLLACNCFTGC